MSWNKKLELREKRNECQTTREVIRMKVQVCTNRHHGQYGDQSECEAGWYVRMMKRRLYDAVQNNTCTESSCRICRETYLISTPRY